MYFLGSSGSSGLSGLTFSSISCKIPLPYVITKSHFYLKKFATYVWTVAVVSTAWLHLRLLLHRLRLLHLGTRWLKRFYCFGLLLRAHAVLLLKLIDVLLKSLSGRIKLVAVQCWFLVVGQTLGIGSELRGLEVGTRLLRQQMIRVLVLWLQDHCLVWYI